MTISTILSAAFSPAVRIGGGVVSPGPAAKSFAKSGKSVAPTVSGFHAAGYPHGPVVRVHKLAGDFGSRRFSKFGAVAGSSGPRADAIHGTGFVAGPTPQTPGAEGCYPINAGGIQ